MIRCLESYSCPGQMFPKGIETITIGQKCVIIVWDDTRIRTLKFDNIEAAIVSNEPYQKMYEYKFEEDHASIKSIVNTSLNTFCLDEDGKIFYFATFKTIEFIENIRNVRAICESNNGFVVIRNGDTAMDVYVDFYSDRGTLKRYKKISISWNEDVFDFERTQENSVLNLSRIDTDPMKSLMSTFEDAEADTNKYTKMVLFSINNSLYCIFYENAKDVHSEVILVRTFLSNIIRIWTNNAIFVMLSTGIIEIIYLDNKQTVTSNTVQLGLDDISAIEIIDNCAYVSDQRICVKVQFQNNAKEGDDQLIGIIEKLHVPGIVAFSYVESLRTVLMVSENNQMYSLRHDDCHDIVVKSKPLGSNSITGTQIQRYADKLKDISGQTEVLESEKCKLNAINFSLNPELISKSCSVSLIIDIRNEFGVSPSLKDMNEVYDIILEFTLLNESLNDHFQTGIWIFSIASRSDSIFKETYTLTSDFCTGKRYKLFQNLCRDDAFIGSDFEAKLEALIGSIKVVVSIPLEVRYSLKSLCHLVDYKSSELLFSQSLKIIADDVRMLSQLVGILFENCTDLEGEHYVALGNKDIIKVVVNQTNLEFYSNATMALHLIKKYLLLESLRQKLWTRIQFGTEESLSICELSARHGLFIDHLTATNTVEISEELRKCPIKLS